MEPSVELKVLEPKRGRGRPRKTEGEPSGSVQSLDRALGLLKVVARHDAVSLSGIAEETDLAASTVHRILTTLEAHEFVRQDSETGLWTVGVGAYSVGQAFVRTRRVEALSRPAMWALMRATGETVNLGVLEEAEAIFLGQVESPAPIRAFFRPGRRGPAYASGIGKALLAEAGEARVRALYGAAPLPAFTEATLADADALVAELAETRRRGWAIDNEEHTLGMRCIAAPIFDEKSRAIAAVSISGPTIRVTDEAIETIAEHTVAAAKEITKAIGGVEKREGGDR